MLEAALGHRKLIDHALSENGMNCQKRHPTGCLFWVLRLGHCLVVVCIESVGRSPIRRALAAVKARSARTPESEGQENASESSHALG
jgi:hypothetical protein